MRTLLLVLAAVSLSAQWLNHPSPGLPRTKDGKPNLTAPAPRTPDGHPDFTGVWIAPSDKYLANIAADGIEIPFRPWAEQVFRERQANHGKDRPSGHCLPHSVVDFDVHHMPKKLIQTHDVLVMLYESYHSFRQIFLDGRALPKDPDPAWFGYSTGKWQGDTLVVDTVGINDKTWLDDGGHPHSDALHVIERFRRPNFGSLELKLTIDDEKAYTKPWSVDLHWNYYPDTDLLDYVCENEQDAKHLVN